MFNNIDITESAALCFDLQLSSKIDLLLSFIELDSLHLLQLVIGQHGIHTMLFWNISEFAALTIS